MLSWPPFSWEMISAVLRGTATQSEERRVMGSLDTMATRVPSSLKRREYSPSPAGHRQVLWGAACSQRQRVDAGTGVQAGSLASVCHSAAPCVTTLWPRWVGA